MSKPTIEPCPFCGSEAISQYIPPHEHFLLDIPPYGGGGFVECTSCSACINAESEEAAIAAWNNRRFRLINKDSLRKSFESECVGECGCCKHGKSNPEGCALIDDAPEPDVVPVIRCKDCKHSITLGNGLNCFRSGSVYAKTKEEDYCSRGEKKERWRMGYNTKIDWCDTSWNPVTGCYHGCDYCYARGIATRFSGFLPEENPGTWGFRTGGTLVELDGMQARKRKDGKIVPAPYPYGFTPTLHRYRLDEPKKWTEPRTIFVCSMADLFGNWIPEEWIKAVFDACLAAPQHKYLFLTKNPFRYHALIDSGILPKDADNFWFGSTSTAPNVPFFTAGSSKAPQIKTFLSIEPILARFDGGPEDPKYMPDWIIVGAETGSRKDKVIPKKEWIDELASWCERWYIPIFMKESLRELMGDDFKQQFPWEAPK